MKRIWYVLLLMLFFDGFSQSTDKLPAQIKKTFNLRYPDATEINWVSNDTSFIIEFTLFEEQKKIVSDLSGKIIQTYTRIKVKDIPGDVKQAIKGYFSNAAILRAERLRTKNDKIHYLVFLEEDESIYAVRFNIAGTIINIKKVTPESTE